jgi:hypothetical protein
MVCTPLRLVSLLPGRADARVPRVPGAGRGRQAARARVPRAVRRGARRMRWRDVAALPLLGDDAARGRGPDALGAARSRWLWARRTRRRTRWSSRSVFCGREDGRLVALGQMVRPPLLIFVQSIERAMQLFHALAYDGLGVDVLHAERTAARGRRRRRTRRAAVARRPTTPRRPTGARRHGHGTQVDHRREATSAAQRWARLRARTQE